MMFCRADVPHLVDEPFLAFVRTRPCFFCGAEPPSDPHHLRARAWREVHRYDRATIPLCRRCHDNVGHLGMEETLERSGLRITDLALGVALLISNYFDQKDAGAI